MNRKPKNDTVRVNFAYVDTSAAASSLKTLSVSPLLTPRLTSLADDFDEYRFTKLAFRLRASGGNSGDAAAAFAPGVTDTAPTTTVQLTEYLSSVFLGDEETVPSNWVNVDRGALAGMHPWYKTVAGTPEVSEEVVGVIYVRCGGATATPGLEMRGTVEFRAASSTATTPLERALAQRRREKARMMNLLAMPDVVVTARPK